jgi:ABC-2 type transport system permease protein
VSRRAGHRVWESAALVVRDLVRNRLATALLIVIPTVLYVLIWVTMGDATVTFQLSALGDRALTAGERNLSLLFMGMTSISGLTAFLAFVLVLRPVAADQRLVFEGFRAGELLLAKILVMLAAAMAVALYVSLLLPLFFRPERPVGVLGAFVLTALVYGALGMVIGAVVRQELEGILVILLLVNLDAGWLQNPVFYGSAQHQEVIRALPGHYPGQVAMLSAFTEGGVGQEAGIALLYAGGALVIAAGLYWLRVRVSR